MADKPDDRPVRSFGVAMPMYWMFQLAFSGRHKAIVKKTVEDTRPDPVVVVGRCIKSARTHLSQFRQTVGTDARPGESATNHESTRRFRWGWVACFRGPSCMWLPANEVAGPRKHGTHPTIVNVIK